MAKKQKRVAVALSGGVDSSVAVALLQKRGYDVTGIYFKTYHPSGDRSACRRAGQSAQRVAETLGIPFKVYDLQEEYKTKIFSYFLNEYRAGRTPNPDVVCNRDIKFGAFAQRVFAEGFHFVATGHYARIRRGFFSRHVRLCRANDKNKDQSYFLALLPEDVLARTIFPLGKLTKRRVRDIAAYIGLHTATQKDSQGLCFAGEELSVRTILSQHIKESGGTVVLLDGSIVGKHDGIHLFTIGQRHGWRILPEAQTAHMPPLFVIDKDVQKKQLIVGRREDLVSYYDSRRLVRLRHVYVRTRLRQNAPIKVMVRIRHRGNLVPARLYMRDGAWYVHAEKTLSAPAAGQFAVCYKNDCIVCAGEIDAVLPVD